MILTFVVGVMAIKGNTSADNGDTEDGELVGERSYNMLFVGTDREAGLGDVIMLANLNLSRKETFIMQIPRDTYAEYHNGSYKKLNGAYSIVGAEGLCDFLHNSLGVKIDYYAVAGLDEIADAVDAIGGVDLDIPCDMKYRDREQGLYIDLKAGVQHLDGEGAEQFLRFRSGYIQGDLDRMDAQKIFIASVASKIKNEFSLSMAYRLLASVDGVETNMSKSDMLNLCVEVSQIDDGAVTVVTMPGEDVRSDAWYYCVSAKACAELMEKHFGVARDGFDKKGLLLCEKYQSFKKIYGGYTPYTVRSLADITENGVKIDFK